MTAPVTMFVGAAVVAGVLAGLCSAGSWGPERVQQHTGYVTVNTQSDNGSSSFVAVPVRACVPLTAVQVGTFSTGCSSRARIRRTTR